MTLVIGDGDRHIADRNLPGADELVAADEAADGAVADGDEESLVRDGRQAQHAIGRLAQIDAR